MMAYPIGNNRMEDIIKNMMASGCTKIAFKAVLDRSDRENPGFSSINVDINALQ